MNAEEHALFANDTFYMAFAEKDIQAMERLWAADHATFCIHPGWPMIAGRREILASWRRILGNPEQPGIDFFIAEHGGMKLFHHHSGPCANPPPPSGARSG